MKLPLELMIEIILYLDKNDIVKYQDIISLFFNDDIWIQLLKRDYKNIMYLKQIEMKNNKDKYVFLTKSVLIILVKSIRDYSTKGDIEIMYTDNEDVVNCLSQLGKDKISEMMDIINHGHDYIEELHEAYLLRIKEYLKGNPCDYEQPLIEDLIVAIDNEYFLEDILIISISLDIFCEVSCSIRFLKKNTLINI